MNRIIAPIFAVVSLAASLLGCAQASGAEEIGRATGSGIMEALPRADVLALAALADRIDDVRLLDAYYVERQCVLQENRKAARVSGPDAELLFVEHLVRCEDGRTPSVVTVFEPGIDGGVSDAVWLASYGVGPSEDGGAIERVEVVGAVAVPEVVEWAPPHIGDAIEAPRPTPAPEPVYTYSFSFLATGSGVGDDCPDAVARAGWDQIADAHDTCFEAQGPVNRVARSEGARPEILTSRRPDGRCEAMVRTAYDCFADFGTADRLNADAVVQDWQIEAPSQPAILEAAPSLFQVSPQDELFEPTGL